MRWVVRIVCSYAFEERMGRMVIAYAEAFSWAVLLGAAALSALVALRSGRVFRRLEQM